MIKLKTKEEIALLREGGQKLAEILREVAALVKPGAETGELEGLMNQRIMEIGGRPSFKGYHPGGSKQPFPTAVCASINDEIVHSPALPSRILKEGDIIGLDVGMEYPFGNGKKGLYTDMAITVPVGKIDPKLKKLIQTTKEALDKGIKAARPGNALSDIGLAIQEHAEAAGFSVVRDLVGHGVGYNVHEDPQVPNYYDEDGLFDDIVLESGLVIAIEPMINLGGYGIRVDRGNGFSIKTKDGKPSAHFEHTIAITDNGNIIITN